MRSAKFLPILFATVLIGGVSIVGAGCSSGPSGPDNAPGPGGSATPQNSSDFTYNPPEGLTQQKDQKKGNTVFLGQKENGFVTNLLVKSGTNTNLKAEAFGKNTLAKITAQPEVTIKEQEAFSVPGSDAYTWEVAKKGKTGLVVDQRQFVVIKNGVVVLFTLTAAESVMPKWDQALADSLQSFKWGR